MAQKFDDVCRVCGSRADLETIFNNENEDILSMLQDVGGYILRENDRFPHHICLPCKLTLDDFYQFKALYKRTYAKYTMTVDQMLVRGLTENAANPDPVGTDQLSGHKEEGSDRETKNADYHEIVVIEDITIKDEDVKQELQANDNDLTDVLFGAQEPHADTSDQQVDKEVSACTLRTKPIPIDSNRGPYQCRFRGNSFSAARALKRHEAYHLNANLYRCEICNKSFAQPSNLRRHDKRYHTGPDPYKCNECSESFARAEKLKAHIALHEAWHLNPNVYKCEICNQSYKLPTLLRKHVWASHENPALYKCNECGKSFAGPKLLKNHEALHSNPDLLKCDLCERTFKTTQSYRYHKILHSDPNKYRCDICNKSFTRPSYVKAHMALHSNPDLFKCDVCGTSFCSANKLKKHKALHSNPHLFKCETCSQSFHSSRKLRDHQVLHKNLDKYQCNPNEIFRKYFASA